jgi:hypothetical protein
MATIGIFFNRVLVFRYTHTSQSGSYTCYRARSEWVVHLLPCTVRVRFERPDPVRLVAAGNKKDDKVSLLNMGLASPGKWVWMYQIALIVPTM